MSYLSQYLQYIVNTGGVNADQFDDDWAPIGPRLRDDLKAKGWMTESSTDHSLTLTPEGEAARVAKD